jgi:hypothetical protein
MLLALATAATAAPSTPFTYRFDEVKSKVYRSPAGDEKQEAKVAKGDAALPNDLVRTGFWANTVLSVPERGSRFEIDSSTRVRLAETEPGVLLVLEKGRLEAFFEKLTEGAPPERRVAAPGALLAVRGTRYGLEVGSDGTALLAVFEGTVEVIPATGGAPSVFVHPNEVCTFGPRTAPRTQPMRAMGMSENAWGSHAPGGMRGTPPGAMTGAPAGMSPGDPTRGGSPMGGTPMGGGHH